MFKKKVLVSIATGLLALALAPAGMTAAQSSAGVEVATGLNAPRGLSMDSDGNLYVAEAGTGGDQTVKVGEMTVKVGLSGRVTKIAPSGAKSVVAPNLVSGASETNEVLGPSSAIFANGAVWLTGIWSDPAMPGPPAFGVIKVDPATGASSLVANLVAFEATNNPDGFIVDSNPYGIALGQDGMLYVADAAGNDLLTVDPATGNVKVVAVFPGIPVPPSPEGGNPGRGGANEADPVPTGITIAPDGHVYVGFLTGFPFLEGAAKIVHVSHEGKVSDAASGLTMVVDVEVGPNDELYASEFGRFSFAGGQPGFVPNSGRVVRIQANGTREVIASGLNQTNGIALDKSGNNLYVVVNSNDAPGTGKVLRFSTTGTFPPAESVGMPRTGAGSELLLLAVFAALVAAAGTGVRLWSERRSQA